MLAVYSLLLGAKCLVEAHDIKEVNPRLGVPGFPDCLRLRPELNLSVEEAAQDLMCHQAPSAASTIRIACVGDSITAGVRSSGGAHTYPSQLQALLDRSYGEGAYSVTNLGACGSTMLKDADSPYWKRPQFQTFINNTWDIIVIMLGTNDAKDKSSGHYMDNWKHDCGGAASASITGCSYAQDYRAMIEIAQKLGRTPASPKIYPMIPPPLMFQGSYDMNQTVINSVYPKLVPLIQNDTGVLGPIDVFTGMGGIGDWRDRYPKGGCNQSTTRPESCKWFCDAQSCDQCHPNDDGYAQLAKTVYAGLGLTAGLGLSSDIVV